MIPGFAIVVVFVFGTFLWWWRSLNDSPERKSSPPERLRFVILHPVMVTVVLFLGFVVTVNALRGPFDPVQTVALFLLFWLEVAAATWAATIFQRVSPSVAARIALVLLSWLMPLSVYALLAGLVMVLSSSVRSLESFGLLAGGAALLLGGVAIERWSRRAATAA